jgi:hypothetical protein
VLAYERHCTNSTALRALNETKIIFIGYWKERGLIAADLDIIQKFYNVMAPSADLPSAGQNENEIMTTILGKISLSTEALVSRYLL